MRRRGTRNRVTALSRAPSGAVMVEAAFTVAVVLIVTFGVIVLSTLANAKAALDVGVGRGLRLGVTRGSVTRAVVDVIPDIDLWIGGAGSDDEPPAALKAFLVSPGQNMSHYNEWSVERFNRKFRQLPREWIYAMVYINEALRPSLGPSLKYPCDVQGGRNLSCLDCRFIDPLLREPGSIGSLDNLAVDPVRIECSFTPLAPAFLPLIALVEMLSGKDVPNPFIVRTVQALDAYS